MLSSCTPACDPRRLLATRLREPDTLDERKALEQLTSEAKKAGGDSLTRGEAEVLVEWAKEQKTKGMIHDAHEPPVDFPHAHIGNQDHIPIKP